MYLSLNPFRRPSSWSKSIPSFSKRLFSTRLPCLNNNNTSQPPPPSPPPPPPPLRGFTKLTNRSLLAIGGPDSAKFLNGIVTNKIISPEDSAYDDTDPTYVSFLNARGRIIAESFVYPVRENTHFQTLLKPLMSPIKNHHEKITDIEVEYLVDCDSQIVSQLTNTMKLYKLRALVSFAAVPQGLIDQWAVWDDSVESSEIFPLSNTRDLSLYNAETGSKVEAFSDVRCRDLGMRLLLSEGMTPIDVLSPSFINALEEYPLEETTLDSYKIRRILFGIPEGVDELVPGRSLPLEGCMDYMNGISFDKGCYVGQELTVRSKHHGIIRKRIIPVVFYSPKLVDEQQSIDEDEAEVDLAYDPASPITSVIDTSKYLIGSNILDLTPREKAVTGDSPFAPRKSTTNDMSKSRPVGSIVTCIGNVGLALVRLQEFAAPDARLAISVIDPVAHTPHYIRVRGFQPYWWPEE